MLKLGRDNAMLWVHSMILSLGSVTLVARLLEGQLNLSAHVVYCAFARLDGAKCRFHTQRLDLPQHLSAHALVVVFQSQRAQYQIPNDPDHRRSPSLPAIRPDARDRRVHIGVSCFRGCWQLGLAWTDGYRRWHRAKGARE